MYSICFRHLAAATMLGALCAGAQGTIAGRVRESSGPGIASAQIVIAGRSGVAVTSSNGTFRINDVPAGPTRVTVRRTGFEPATGEFAMTDGRTVDMVVELVPLAAGVQQVTVTDRQAAAGDPRLAGFLKRQRSHLGRFITHEQIESRTPLLFTDLLRDVPGVRVGPIAGSSAPRAVRMRGQNCWPVVFLDGFAAGAGEFDVDVIDPMSVEGVEIYSGPAGVPVELMGPQDQLRCGAIVIWTRMDRPGPRRHQLSPNPEAVEASLQGCLASGTLFAADAVDRPAILQSRSYAPAYPDELIESPVIGSARVQFVVDAAGNIEWETVSVVSASHPAFADAAIAGLERASFVPASKDRAHVRQLFHVAVRFEPPT